MDFKLEDVTHNKKRETMEDQILFAKALAFAAEKHKLQTRNNGTPYIYHPIKVAEIIKDAGYNIRFQ